MNIKAIKVLIYMDTLSTKTYRSKKLLHKDINSFVQFKIQRRQYTVNGFIFVGTHFCGLNKIDKFMGFQIH